MFSPIRLAIISAKTSSRAMLTTTAARVVKIGMNARDFSQGTLKNALKYLQKRQENGEIIQYQVNESGFVRMRFPNSILASDAQVARPGKAERIRANFWYADKPYYLGDESIHDHPNAFESYIVSGGYEHEIYSLSNKLQQNIAISFQNKTPLNPEQLQELFDKISLYNSYLDPNESEKHKFTIDKVKKVIRYQGMVVLRFEGVEKTKAGDIIKISPHMIHRVSLFCAVPNEKTLSLNIVRNHGKGKTNIFLSQNREAAVKTERDTLSPEESTKVTQEMMAILHRSIH